MDLESTRDDLLRNEMSTERVTSKYEKCDVQLQSEIKGLRMSGDTNLAFSIMMHKDVAILEHQLKAQGV